MLATILFLGRDNIALLAKNDDVINPVAGLFHLITYKRSTSLPIISLPTFFFLVVFFPLNKLLPDERAGKPAVVENLIMQM